MSGPDASFLPVLSPADVQQAAQLIQQAYAPQAHLSSEEQRKLQQELFGIQKRPEAWGLVLPFLSHTDPNVQFFGAHTIQVKIARDWSLFPHENAPQLRDLLVSVTGRLMLAGGARITIRKLFVAITSLALKLTSQSPSQWPDWLSSTVEVLSRMGASAENLLDLCTIGAEEIGSADLLAPERAKIRQTLADAIPMVMQAVKSCITTHSSSGELRAALKCLQAWMFILPANDLTPVIPLLIGLISPTNGQNEFDEDEFELVVEALDDIMSSSTFAGGAGTKTLTEPLLVWCERYGGIIIDRTMNEGFADSLSHSFCKLLAALGDHSVEYFASNLASQSLPTPALPFQILPTLPPKSHLVQTFLRLLLAYAGMPGYWGVDEEESDMTLDFWYLFQEALWSVDSNEGEDDATPAGPEDEQARISRAVYFELVKVLRRKVIWPERTPLSRWTRDQRDKFQAYRRDVGDTLVNAFYVLRDDMLSFYVNDLAERLASRRDTQPWEEVEGTLHCIMAVQEAVPIQDNPHLRRLFGPAIFGKLPTSGNDRVRRTAIILIGTYASWFTSQPAPASPSQSILMTAISYVVSALPEPELCLPAANSLRELCDANRTALAPHISAFGELHAGLSQIPDTEKSKILQSISSVIQALPPLEEIAPIEAIVNPVISKLYEALQSSSQLPEEARALAVQQLQTIAGVARGLTEMNDTLLLEESSDTKDGAEQMRRAREDPRVIQLRDGILDTVRRSAELWCTDATVSDALNELLKAVTSLPSDVTLLSLPPVPLLEIVCLAAQRQLTAVWLSLATMLIIQLDPPSLLPTTFKPMPPAEAHGSVLQVVGALLQTSLQAFGQPGMMPNNPDVVQAFFNCMETVAQHFISVFYHLPPELFNALVQCATGALSLQERYSLVSACSFLSSLVGKTATNGDLNEAKDIFVRTHGRNVMHALLSDFAGVAPRSATPNLVELLSTFITRFPLESKAWMIEIFNAPDFMPSKATPEAKDRFVKTIFGSRSLKRTRDAAQQFVLVARGLEGTTFGYASVTM